MRKFKEIDEKVMSKYMTKLFENLSFSLLDFELSVECEDELIYKIRLE
jgi:hypothetical protein